MTSHLPGVGSFLDEGLGGHVDPGTVDWVGQVIEAGVNWSNLDDLKTPVAGLTLGQLRRTMPGAYYALIKALDYYQNLSVVANRGRGKVVAGHPVNPAEIMATLGCVPKLLPAPFKPPYCSVIDMMWPAHPWFSHTAPFLTPSSGGEDADYFHDDTWESPAMPDVNDVAISDFRFPITPFMNPWEGTGLVPSRMLVPRMMQGYRVYTRYLLSRWSFEITIHEVDITRGGHYMALVAPKDFLLWTVTNTTGVATQGSDNGRIPAFARTNASITTDQAAGTLEPFTYGTNDPQAQQQRIAQMKASPFTIAWCYFPARHPTSSDFDGSVAPRSKTMSFNLSCPALSGSTYSDGASVGGWPWRFVGEIQYGPSNVVGVGGTGFRSEVNHSHAPNIWSIAQATDNAWAGFRLVWIPEGPGLDETTALTGHDNDQVVAPEAVWRCTSRMGAQFVFFEPSADFQDLDLSAVSTDTA